MIEHSVHETNTFTLNIHCILCCKMNYSYHIVGNFQGRKLSQILQFCGYPQKFSLRNLGAWLLWCSKSEQSTKIFFVKIIQFAQVFSLESLYRWWEDRGTINGVTWDLNKVLKPPILWSSHTKWWSCLLPPPQFVNSFRQHVTAESSIRVHTNHLQRERERGVWREDELASTLETTSRLMYFHHAGKLNGHSL